MTISFATTITVPHAIPDPSTALLEQLLQDGFFQQDLQVPLPTDPNFAAIVQDALNFSAEVQRAGDAWPVRCERWLNRLSLNLTGKVFTDLSSPHRLAIAHAALTLGGQNELVR